MNAVDQATKKPGIVLFNPSPLKGSRYNGLPLPLLAVAALPHAKGYPVTIVTEDVSDDPVGEVLAACEGALLVGITSLTGSMIGSGLDMARLVREKYPNLPIVWGGTHASIAPEQTCEHPLVDVVVAGQGEATFMDLIETIERGDALDGVAGILFKRDGEIVKTACRGTIDIDALPPLPFELLDMERFIVDYSKTLERKLAGRRGVTYYTSYGCPFSCSFCSEPLTSNRRWFAKSPETVVAEIAELHDRYGANCIVFEDPIYFVDLRRVKRICELILERGLDIKWAASSRLETIKKIDGPTWDLLKRSGFHQVFIGVESASPTVLKGIGKRYTADDIVEATRILGEQDVTLVCSFIQGIPVEAPGRTLDEISAEDMRLASQTIVRMCDANPKVQIGVLMYTPYPGAAAFELGKKYGFVAPETLEGWTTFIHQENQVPWMLPEQEAFSNMAPLGIKTIKRGGMHRIRRRKLKGSVLAAYGAISRSRFERGYFKHPIEHAIAKKLFGKAPEITNDPDQQSRGMLI